MWQKNSFIAFTFFCLTTPLFAADAVTSVDTLVATALQRNPSLAAMSSTLDALEHATQQAGSLDDPMLMTRTAPSSWSGDSTSYMLEISQRLPWPGKRAAMRNIAEQEARMQAANVAVAQLALTSDVKATVADYLFAMEALSLHTTNRQLLEELKNLVLSRYEAGGVDKQDVLLTELTWRSLFREKLQRERQLSEMRTRLNILLNQAADTPIPPLTISPLPQQLPNVIRLRDLALLRHPEFTSHLTHISAEKETLKLAQLDRYPDVEIQAGYDRFMDDAEDRAILGVSINLPLQSAKRTAQEQQATAQVQAAQWALADKRNQLMLALRLAWDATQEAQGTLVLYEQQLLPLAKENREAALSSYRSGTGDLNKVLNAEQQVASVELELAASKAALRRAWAALENTAGGASVVAEVLSTTTQEQQP